MRSTFAGLSIAQSGLFAAQRSLDITGHNIANANTRGYSRQRLNQSAANPLNIAGGKGQLGIGVDMKHITQIRDEFMDIKYRDEMTVLGEWEERYMALTQIESIFNEPSKNGIRAVMDRFYQGLHDLSVDPANPTSRAVVLQNSVALAQTLNQMNNQFEKMVLDLNQEVEATVTDINAIADQIAQLNKQIYEVEADGSKANDLRDARNVLIDDLSKLIDIQVVNVVEPGAKFSKMNILVQGTALVGHDKTNKIDMIKNEEHPLRIDGQKLDPERTDLSTIKVTNIQWSTGAPINQDSLKGTLGGQLDQRDNFEGSEKGVPYYIRMINEFTTSFADEFNRLHEKGIDLDGNGGLPFFTTGGGTGVINARNIQVNDVILKSPSKIAAGYSSSVDDARNIVEMLGIRDKNLAVNIEYSGTPNTVVKLLEGKPDDILKSMISVLGVDAQQAKRVFENQTLLSDEIDSYRMSVSGVHLDEEMSNMIKYQHAYNASARMITTVDEMIDVIINRMGRVGL